MKTILFFCITQSLMLLSCSGPQEKTTPFRQSISESVYASGIIKSKDQYEAYANANGLIHEIFVSEGDTVEAGTPILSIFNETARLNRESAELARAFADRQANQTKLRDLEINIELAKSRLENDSMLLVRQRNLREKRIGSMVDLEQRKLAYDNSRTALQVSHLKYQDLKREIDFNERNASKNLAMTQVLESDLIVKSKVGGMVYALLKEKGEMVSTQTPLAIIGSEEEFILELQVDEYDIVKIEKNQKILVSMDSYRGEVFEAMVTKINPIMDERSKSFTVEALFVEKPAKLYPHLTLEANILIQAKENVLLLPRNFIYQDRYVIRPNGDTVEVILGIKDFQKAEILEGLDENMEVIKPGR